MAESGSIKHRLEAARARVDELNRKAQQAGMTVGPRAGYRMNNDEFMHHVVALAHERIIREKLGLSEDEYKLYINETWADEWEKLMKVFVKAKSDSIRAELTRGITTPPPTPGG